MLSLLAKILGAVMGRDPWRRPAPVKIAIPREPRTEVIEIQIRKPMSVLTRRVNARTATRRRIRFEKAHWQIPLPGLILWDGSKGRYVPL